MGGKTVEKGWQHDAVVTCSRVHFSPTGLGDIFLMGRLDNVGPTSEGTAWVTQLGEAVETPANECQARARTGASG